MGEFSWISASPTVTGATPLWHPDERRLYWGDASTGRLSRLDAADGSVDTLLSDGSPIGAMTLQADGSILLFRGGGLVELFRGGSVAGAVAQPSPEFRLTRFCAAAAAPDGRVVCAMLADIHHSGRLFLLGRDGRLSQLADGFASPGGIAFAPDGKSFFVSDSHVTRRVILRFPYCAGAENPCGEPPSTFRECIEDARDWPGRPTGLAAAADGSLWTARCDAAAAVRHDADGVPVEQLRLKVRRPVGLCFGGETMTDLFVASSGAHRRVFEGVHAGDMIRMKGMAPGARPFLSLVMLPGLPAEAAIPHEPAPLPEEPVPDQTAEEEYSPPQPSAMSSAGASGVIPPSAVVPDTPAAPAEEPRGELPPACKVFDSL